MIKFYHIIFSVFINLDTKQFVCRQIYSNAPYIATPWDHSIMFRYNDHFNIQAQHYIHI